MNRIQAFAPAPEVQVGSEPSLLEQPGLGLFAPVRGENPCAFFAPQHYESNYAYPLLIWLHGPGDDENHLKRIMPLVSMRNYVGASLRGTVEVDGNRGRPGFSWSQARSHVALAEQRVLDVIDMAQDRYNLAPRRVFLAGFDVGGTMAFRLAMSNPERFAGVLSLGGEFPSGRMPLLRLSEARRVPIFLACGRESQKLPTTTVCENLKLFHSAGMHVALRQYPCGHQMSPLMLADMDRWMMEQVTSSPR
jgi:phospholipase/carboxylesterase